MARTGPSATTLALLGCLALAAPATARETVVRIRVGAGRNPIQLGLHKDNKDNAVIQIYAEGNDRAPIETLDPSANLKANLSPGTNYKLKFSGFLAYCSPKMYVRTMGGNGVTFDATFGTLDKVVTFRNFNVVTGTNPCTVTSDGAPNQDGLSMLITP